MSYEKFRQSKTPIAVEATMPDGSVETVHFIKCSHMDFERWRMAENSSDPSVVERAKQQFIAACLVDADGARALTEKESIGLTAEGVSVLLPLALEVSGITKRKSESGNGSGEAAESTGNATSP